MRINSKVLISLFLILIAFTNMKAQSNELNYFIGTWKFAGWQSTNNTESPDYIAIWKVEQGLNKATALIGYVELDSIINTREIIAYNSKTKEYIRTIVANDGSYFVFTSAGWKKEKLIWIGSQQTSGQKIEMKEEITRLNEKECKAVFFQLKNGKWIEGQREILKKIT